MRSSVPVLTALAVGLPVLATPSLAATCSAKGDDFGTWLAGYSKTLVDAGLPADTVQSALSGISFDPAVIKKDRGQGVFSQTFAEFAGRMVNKNRLTVGAQKIKANADIFGRIQAQFGVPAEVIVAVWGLESDFGANTGDFPTLQSLATLAYDCRRPVMFQNELLDALQIVARGDLAPSEMKGAWAGELGQTQFLPSNYVRYAVDFDGDGRRNLIKSAPDVLGSTANYLHSLGWTPGQPWLVEVDIPSNLPWDQADLPIKKPVSEWQAMGGAGREWNYSRRSGRPLSAHGTLRSGFPRLSQFRRLPRLERIAGLLDNRCLFRNQACRRTAGRCRQRQCGSARGLRYRLHPGGAVGTGL